MAVRIQFRRGTAAEWASANPVLAAGELGYEVDTAKFKLGDATTSWNALNYAGINQQDIEDAIANVIALAPEDLDTLSELAAAIGEDPDFINTINESIATAESNAATYTDTAIASLVDSAPATLNTLNELSAALNNDENFYLTLQNSINATNTYVIAYVDDHIEEVTDQLAADLASYATSADLAAAVAPLATSADLTNAVGNHEQDITNVHGIANTADLVVSSQLETSIANHAVITTNIHGIADTADLVVTANLISEIASHNETTINVHGIADTSLLATQSFAENYADDAINQFSLVTTNVHGIANTALLATKEYSESYTNTALSNHEEDTTNVHGIANTADLVIQSDIVYLSNVTSDIQEQLDAKLATASAASIYAPIADATLTGTVSLPATTSIGDVSGTEIGYLDGVTSSVQTQLDAKAPTESPTFTGTVSGITASMVGLSNVDNTSDLNKPISNATQTALDAKLSLAGGTMTGKITLDGDPTQALHATTKQYVDNVASGILAKPAVYAATTANLDATYSNGTDGVGATLTATSNGAFPVVDGVQLTTENGTRGLLVKNQSNAFENGRYNLTTLGDENTPWVLTRCGLCDEADEIPGMYVFVTDGTTNEGTGWVGYVSDPTTYEVGTDSVSFFQFAGSGAVTAGNNISVVGNQVSLVDAPTFTNTITVSSEGIEFSDGTVQTSAGVASLTSFTEKTANYTLDTLDHKDNVVEMNSGSALTFTIPTNATLEWPIGASMDIIQTGSGQVTIANAVGVTLNFTPGNKLRTQWSSCTIMKRGTDSWILYGDLTA